MLIIITINITLFFRLTLKNDFLQPSEGCGFKLLIMSRNR